MSVALQDPPREVASVSSRRHSTRRPQHTDSDRGFTDRGREYTAPQRKRRSSDVHRQHVRPASGSVVRSPQRSVSLGPVRDFAPTASIRRPKSKTTFWRAFFEDFGLEKLFTVFSFLTAVSLVFICGPDLLLARPFKAASPIFDVTFLLSGLVMLGLTWSVAKDQVRGYVRSRRRQLG